jgi:hypothetical protein
VEKLPGCPSHLVLHGAGIQVVYREPVRGPVADTGLKGKSLMLKENLLNFFHKFTTFRLPIKMPVFRVKGHTRDFPGVPFSSRDCFP